MTVKVEILDDDDKRNKQGILRDGERRTIHMFDSKGAPLPGFTPVQIAIARTKDAMQSFDASMHRPGFRRAAATGTADSAAHQSTRFGVYDGVREKAYAERDRETADAWKSKSTDSDNWLECIADNHDGDDGDDGSNPYDSRTGKVDATKVQQIRDAAFQEYDEEIQNRWRNK